MKTIDFLKTNYKTLGGVLLLWVVSLLGVFDFCTDLAVKYGLDAGQLLKWFYGLGGITGYVVIVCTIWILNEQ